MEKRNFIRTSLKCDFSARLQLDGQDCSAIQVSNISIRGCCLQLPTALAQRLPDESVLDALILFRDAREYSVKARIVWHGLAGEEIKAGVEFLETTRECLRALRESVADEMLFWNTAS